MGTSWLHLPPASPAQHYPTASSAPPPLTATTARRAVSTMEVLVTLAHNIVKLVLLPPAARFVTLLPTLMDPAVYPVEML